MDSNISNIFYNFHETYIILRSKCFKTSDQNKVKFYNKKCPWFANFLSHIHLTWINLEMFNAKRMADAVEVLKLDSEIFSSLSFGQTKESAPL